MNEKENKAVQQMALDDALDIIVSGKVFDSAERYVGLKRTNPHLALRYSTELSNQLAHSLGSSNMANILSKSIQEIAEKIELLNADRENVQFATKDQEIEFKSDLENKFHLRGRDIAKDIVNAPNFASIFGEGMGIAGNGMSSAIKFYVSKDREDQTIQIDLAFDYVVVNVDDES